jgi:hypothetical protein
MADYTDFSFMRPAETESGEGPIKQFFQRLFSRRQGGLVGDAPATLAKKEPESEWDFRRTVPRGMEGKPIYTPKLNPNRRATTGAITDAEKEAIDQSEREKMLEYMRHPSYKERLKKEIFYDSFDPNNKRNVKTVEDEYKRRLQDVTTIPISRGKYSEVKESEMPYGQYFPIVSYGYQLPGGKKGELYKRGFPQIVMSEDEVHNEINANPNLYRQVLRHELGHASHAGSLGGWAYSDNQNDIPLPGMVKEKLQQHSESPLMKQKEAVSELMSPYFVHNTKGYQNKTIELANQKIGPEKVQQILEAQKRMNAEFQALKKDKGTKYAQEKGPDWNNREFMEIQNTPMIDNLDQNDTEVATRMIGLRRLAADKFGHDMNEDFDIKKYKDQIQDYFKKNGMINEYNHLSKDLELSDDQINEMMKYIARNPSQQQTGRYTG